MRQASPSQKNTINVDFHEHAALYNKDGDL